MAVLLATNALLWHVTGHPRLSTTAKMWVDDPAQDVFVSIASLWEITIKTSLGKLQLATSLAISFNSISCGAMFNCCPLNPRTC